MNTLNGRHRDRSVGRVVLPVHSFACENVFGAGRTAMPESALRSGKVSAHHPGNSEWIFRMKALRGLTTTGCKVLVQVSLKDH